MFVPVWGGSATKPTSVNNGGRYHHEAIPRAGVNHHTHSHNAPSHTHSHSHNSPNSQSHNNPSHTHSYSHSGYTHYPPVYPVGGASAAQSRGRPHPLPATVASIPSSYAIGGMNSVPVRSSGTISSGRQGVNSYNNYNNNNNGGGYSHSQQNRALSEQHARHPPVYTVYTPAAARGSSVHPLPHWNLQWLLVISLILYSNSNLYSILSKRLLIQLIAGFYICTFVSICVF